MATGSDIGGSESSRTANQFLDPLDLFGARANLGQQEALDASTLLQTSTSAANIDLQRDMFEQQVELQEPWRQAGITALETIQNTPDFQFSVQDFEAMQDPSYQFRMDEGINALDRSAASRGRLLSGAQDRAVTRYGQDFASQEYGNAFARAKNTYGTNLNTQKALAGVGQQATDRVQSAGNVFSQGVITQNTAGTNALSQQQLQSANIASQQQQQTASTVGSGIGLLAAFSDIRLKENIEFVETKNGHKIYTWDWKDKSITDKNRGVLAQEVQEYLPEAVTEDAKSGFLKVNYEILGLQNAIH